MRRFVALSLLVLSLPVAAQAAIAPPSVGLNISYSFWPEQYVQFVGTELPYSMLELDVDRSGKTPVYNVVLTDRLTGRRVQYANNDAVVAAGKASGYETHRTEIAFDASETTNTGSISTLRLALADGKPLQWRFVQGSDLSEQGSGLTALPQVPVPAFAYREQGAVAGEGTALQIGDVVSVAEVWTEISKPPYFVAYRGGYTQSAHRLIFTTGEQSWTITASPKALAIGSVWEMEGADGEHRVLKVERVDGGHYVISGSDRQQPSVRFAIDATRMGDAWGVNSVRYAPVQGGEKHGLAVVFGTPVGASTASSTVSLIAGKKTNIAAGVLTVSGTADDRTVLLDMKEPKWVGGKALREETTIAEGKVSTKARLTSK